MLYCFVLEVRAVISTPVTPLIIICHYSAGPIYLMYQSVPCLTILSPGSPRRFARSHCPGGRVFAQLSLPGVSGVWIREIFHSSERNMPELLDLIQRNQRLFEKQVFLCCFISIFAITVDVYCIFNDIDHFRPYRSFVKIFRSSNGHFCQC